MSISKSVYRVPDFQIFSPPRLGHLIPKFFFSNSQARFLLAISSRSKDSLRFFDSFFMILPMQSLGDQKRGETAKKQTSGDFTTTVEEQIPPYPHAGAI